MPETCIVMRWNELCVITAESADRRLLRDDEIDEEHEEDTDDKADVEVDRRRPALHAFLGSLLTAAHRLFLLPAALLPMVAVVRMRREGSEGFNQEKKCTAPIEFVQMQVAKWQNCIDFNKVLVSHFI